LEPWFLLLIMIEMAGIHVAFEFWDVWSFLVSDALPVDTCEERMNFNLFNTVDSESLSYTVMKTS
jgi:uncharacterized protein YegL